MTIQAVIPAQAGIQELYTDVQTALVMEILAETEQHARELADDLKRQPDTRL